MIETDAIRKRLISEGTTDPFELHFAVVSAYDEAHKNDPTYRERSETFSAKTKHTGLSNEEISYLIDRLEGVNDPLGQSALVKLKGMLK
jgi:hypothetical protein